MRLNPVMEELGTYPIAVVQERARSLRDAGARLIDFSIGDPREPTPPFIREALRTAVPEVTQYPTVHGLASLRHAFAAYLGRRFGVEVDPETQVIPTTGSKEAIFSTPLAFVAAGETVVYGTPGYPIYERGARFAGAKTHPVRLGGDFVLRAGQIGHDALGAARIVWVCSPHNPTGAVTTAGEYRDLLDATRDAGALLGADECYVDLYDAEPPSSVLQVAGPGSPGVLAYYSCSKRSGMTGYRSGAIVGDPEAIAVLRRFRSSVGTAPQEFVQEAAAAAWADDDHAVERRAVFAEKRAVLREAFAAMGYQVVASQAGLYLWVAVDDDVAVTQRLLEEGVVVSPGRAFGPGGEGYLRLALVPTVAECRDAVEVLRQCLAP
jgi:succinyldiaminopimelate transaminase